MKVPAKGRGRDHRREKCTALKIPSSGYLYPQAVPVRWSFTALFVPDNQMVSLEGQGTLEDITLVLGDEISPLG